MDCSVVQLKKHKDLSMVSTTDYFYPLVDDPYMQGRIGCANVLSDLYAFGVVNCDNILMILAVSTDMNTKEREVATKFMIKGFTDLAAEAGTMVTGGQTVMNPWPIIGGTATSICTADEFIRPEGAVDGDVIVLTKPLGIQVAVNVSQWRYNETKWDTIKHIVTKEEAGRAYEYAMYSMARLNRTGASLMHKHGAHAATDVTGFGILGHGRNLASNQKAAVNFEIHTLPIIKHLRAIDVVMKRSLMAGTAAETSGGLFVCLPPAQAAAFCKEIEEIDHAPAWIIGRVVASNSNDRSKNTCTILGDVTVIEV